MEKPRWTRRIKVAINLIRSLMRYMKKERKKKKAKSRLSPFFTLGFYKQEKTLPLMDFSKI
jgi:hypothetical protein